MTREKRVGTRIVGHDCGASPHIKRAQIKAKNGLARDASIGLYRVTSDTVSTGRYGTTNCWTSHSCKCPPDCIPLSARLARKTLSSRSTPLPPFYSVDVSLLPTFELLIDCCSRGRIDLHTWVARTVGKGRLTRLPCWWVRIFSRGRAFSGHRQRESLR
jgi:hypothetical protein